MPYLKQKITCYENKITFCRVRTAFETNTDNHFMHLIASVLNTTRSTLYIRCSTIFVDTLFDDYMLGRLLVIKSRHISLCVVAKILG